jgi:hypothetical protein
MHSNTPEKEVEFFKSNKILKVPSMYEALGLIPSTTKKKKQY